MERTLRQLAREYATIGVYQYLTVGASLDDISIYLEEKELNKGQSGYQFAYDIVKGVIDNKESYIQHISKYLKSGWTFERLGKMEQAILLVGACELLEFHTDKRIVINEAVINSKLYCDETSFGFINGVLNRII